MTDGSYLIYLNGSIIESGLLNDSSDIVSTRISTSKIAILNYTIVVFQYEFHVLSDTVIVVVSPDTTNPTIPPPNDKICIVGTIGHNITWFPEDKNPNSYEIWRNGSLVIAGKWNRSGEAICINIDGLPVGLYIHKLIVWDIEENNSTDTVELTILESMPPLEITRPMDIEYYVGEVGNTITWRLISGYPDTLEFYRNRSLLYKNNWSGRNYSVNVDYLSMGTYNFTIRVSQGNVSVRDMVWVSVIQKSAISTTTNLGNTTTTTSANSNFFNRNARIFTISVTIGSLIIIVLFSVKICRHSRMEKWESLMQE
jgi:hypothetical protein